MSLTGSTTTSSVQSMDAPRVRSVADQVVTVPDAGGSRAGTSTLARMPTALQPGPTDASTGFMSAGAARRSAPIHAASVATRRLDNPLAGTRWFPLFAVLGHRGRTSGTPYRPPVVTFAIGDHFLIPLPFGDRTQWAKNLLAAGEGTLRHRGHDAIVGDPGGVDRAAVASELPRWVRFASGRLGIRQFVRVRRLG